MSDDKINKTINKIKKISSNLSRIVTSILKGIIIITLLVCTVINVVNNRVYNSIPTFILSLFSIYCIFFNRPIRDHLNKFDNLVSRKAEKILKSLFEL